MLVFSAFKVDISVKQKLSYSLKSGFGSYWSPDMIGGTTITINKDGNVKLENRYYDLQENNWDITND